MRPTSSRLQLHALAAVAVLVTASCAELPTPTEPAGLRAVNRSADAVFSGRLFGISGASDTPSSLYLIDRTTAASTLIGATGYSHVVSMDFDPTTGILYGIANRPRFGGSATTLLTINTTTGVATPVAAITWPAGDCGDIGNSPDMSFNSSGVLYAWRDPCDDDAYTIDKVTGVPTLVGESFMGTAAFGLAFNSADELFGKIVGSIYRINTTTGQGTFHSNLFVTLQNMLAFDENDVAWSGSRFPGSPIYTFDINGGPVTHVGNTNIPFLAALAFERITNQAPVCDAAAPSLAELWPPDHSMRNVTITGVTDPDGDAVSITITGIMQDEPVNAVGDGSTSPDGAGVGTSTAQVRAERSGTGNGRVYEISFTASDGRGGSCGGTVAVGVRHSQGKGPKGGPAVNDGATYDSTIP